MGLSGALEVAPTPVAPAKQTPRAASRHFITLHQIKSNKLITNDCGHASSKYRINIIDLILSMLSEKLINAGAKITALSSRAAATTGRIKRSREVHSTKINSRKPRLMERQRRLSGLAAHLFPFGYEEISARAGFLHHSLLGGGGCFMHASLNVSLKSTSIRKENENAKGFRQRLLIHDALG